MNTISQSFASNCTTLLVLAALATPAMADRHGHQEHQIRDQESERYQRGDYGDHENRDEDRFNREREHYFNDDHRTVVREYYSDAYNSGRCPPGLRKKHNYCQPPGLSKRWVMGRPLPRDVIYYDLPPTVIQRIGYPPAGYRYVRVASDILMISIATGLVMDAIADLNGR
jgi:Ni/Co efflux regulator RcnB